MMGSVMTAVGLLLTCGAGALALEPIVLDFEDPDSPLNEVWTVSPLDGPHQSMRICDEKPRSGKMSLKLYGRLPDGFGVTYYPWQDWTGYTKLSFDLWVPPDAGRGGPDSFDCWAYLKDSSYYWFQTPVLANPMNLKQRVPFVAGGWNHFELDISPSSTIWTPGGHKRSWDYATYKPREFGLRFFGEHPWEGVVYLDNVTLSGEDLPLGKRTGGPAAARVDRSLRVVPSAQAVPMYEKFELTFNIDRHYENPFDPEVVDVQGHFVAPSGQAILVPGFFYQDYERSLTPDGFEQLIPVGRPCWKVRFAPREQGRYTYWVTVNDARGQLECLPASFTALAPRDPRGYVRVSKTDPLYFEWENGDWFYPLGINMRDGGDDASRQKGTYDFDYYFRRFHEEGLNFVRTWMCAWWAGIEWSDEYHSRFTDIGRYNTYNAWRLDYLVDLARQYDLVLEVTFNSHGQLRRDKFDEEWTYSPWNPRNGGYLSSPAMFFTSERAKRDFRNRYRYIVARWGYSRNIMSWDLWNEIDLAEGYDPATAAAWHQEMARYLRSIDPWQHIISTHICLFWSFGNELWQLPEMEYVKSDAYWDQKEDQRLDMGMYVSYLGKTNPGAGFEPIHRKPFVFIEYGPLYTAVSAGQVTADLWRNRFRTGMWTSAVLPNAAPAMFWYPREWEQYGLYRYQKPLQRLFAHLDRRGRGFRMKPLVLVNGGDLRGIGMADESEGFFYVHNPNTMGVEERAQVTAPTEGATALLSRMPAGKYNVEFVDTLTAEVISRLEVELPERHGPLKFTLPPVADDLLVHTVRKQ